MVNRLLLIASLAFVLHGCAKDAVPPPVVPSGALTVKVPVPTCGDGLEKAIDRSSANSRPLVLPIQRLTTADKENYDKVQSAYVQTVAILVEYTGKLEADQNEVQLLCQAAKEQVETLNTVQPNIPSATK